MSNERVIVTDQEGKSMAQHLASAERELSAFVTAVHTLFGPEQARWLINMGVDSSRKHKVAS